MKKYTIFFSCGDRSADNYLSLLLHNLSRLTNDVNFVVLGGEKSKPFADKFLEDVVSYDAHGFFSPFSQFYKFVKLYLLVRKFIKTNLPNLVVLLDFYGFNIRVAKIAKKFGCKVVYYITPQVWASRMYRVNKIKKYVDYVINVLPFEPQIFMNKGIKVFYFGHPITDIITEDNNTKNAELIGLFPGSRKQVIQWNLPYMLNIVQVFLNNYSKQYKFVIFGFDKYKKLYNELIYKHLTKEYHQYVSIQPSTNELRKKIIFAITVSGTVCLENVFYNIPMVVIYNLPRLMYWLLKKLVYTSYIALPNIILNEQVVPEFIKDKIDVEQICEYIHTVLSDNDKKEKMLSRFDTIKQLLGKNKNVSFNVATKLLEILNE